MIKTTRFKRKEDVRRNWYLIDAAEKPVGRIASMAAHILRGKHHPDYTPHIDNGDHVIVINAAKIQLTGNKMDQKVYYRHSGYPGGLKEATAKEMLEKHPDRIIKFAVKGMLPKTRLGRKLLTKLRVFPGKEHVHIAQKPIQIALSEKKFIEAVK